jgi:hypothetical protein
MTAPGWPPKDWRAIIALLASIAGAAVLTGLLAWIIRLFQLWVQPDPLARIAYGLLGIIGAVLLSLGLAINRRTLKLSRDGFEASGGDEAVAAADQVAGAATDAAQDVKDNRTGG